MNPREHDRNRYHGGPNGSQTCACGCGRTPNPGRLYLNSHHFRDPSVWLAYDEQDRGYRTPCWIWTRNTNNKGYGLMGNKKAHRVFYERHVAPIPPGLEIDHLCRVKLCVNPEHLEPVTRQENMRRAYADITHCVHGHEFTEENTYIRPDNGCRMCRTCNLARKRAHYWAKKAAA